MSSLRVVDVYESGSVGLGSPVNDMTKASIMPVGKSNLSCICNTLLAEGSVVDSSLMACLHIQGSAQVLHCLLSTPHLTLNPRHIDSPRKAI